MKLYSISAKNLENYTLLTEPNQLNNYIFT